MNITKLYNTTVSLYLIHIAHSVETCRSVDYV